MGEGEAGECGLKHQETSTKLSNRVRSTQEMKKLKFPLMLEQAPPVYNTTSQPKYCYGWIIPGRLLQKYAKEAFGWGNVENMVMRNLLPRWQEQLGSCFFPGEYAVERVAFIATNCTTEELGRAGDKDYVEAAKKALRVEEEPTWFYCDRRSRNTFVKWTRVNPDFEVQSLSDQQIRDFLQQTGQNVPNIKLRHMIDALRTQLREARGLEMQFCDVVAGRMTSEEVLELSGTNELLKVLVYITNISPDSHNDEVGETILLFNDL
ncbi:hypothetical protein BT69DRAFT_1293738 [Atractiella rhizophila]|nr:hypothetical protein BT69DRAFT_1293738 [Atractiella rhizophila]